MAKGTAVAQKAPPTLKQLVEMARPQIAKVLPAHMNVDQVIQGVRLAIAQNPTIARCKPETVLFAVMAASRVGLELNSPLQHAWLIPYKDECTLQVGYRGYQELARRGGQIRNIEARCVFQGDDFQYELGSQPFIKHKPGGATDAKTLTHAYAVAFFNEGGTPTFDVLTRSEIEAARRVSRMADGGAWKDWYAEQARKTAVRRLAKYLPLSPEMAAAIELDLRGDTGKVENPSTLLDTDVSLAAGMQEKTEQQLAELREHMKGQSPNTGGVDGAPAGPATPAPSASEEAPPVGEQQPW